MTTRPWMWRSIGAVALLLCATLLQGSSCLPNPTPIADSVTRSFDSAIASLSSQSTQWSQTLRALEADMVTQGQSTLANQVQSLINRSVSAVGMEAKCGADFLAARLSEELQVILAHFKGQDAPPPMPHFCSVDPYAVDLRLSPSERPATLNVYGYNLQPSNIDVAVVDVNGSRAKPPAGIFNFSSEYIATFNIVNYPFASTSQFISFKLPQGEEQTVGITQPPKCGGVGQPCCSDQKCDHNSGCLTGTCVTCPPIYTPPPERDVTLVNLTDEFDGNNCTGVNNTHHYGGACEIGTHRKECSVQVQSASSDTSCSKVNGNGWVSSDPHDCRCDVLFHSPGDCFKGIHCSVRIIETVDVPPPPSHPFGCP